MSQIQYVTVLYFGRALVPKHEVGLYIPAFFGLTSPQKAMLNQKRASLQSLTRKKCNKNYNGIPNRIMLIK